MAAIWFFMILLYSQWCMCGARWSQLLWSSCIFCQFRQRTYRGCFWLCRLLRVVTLLRILLVSLLAIALFTWKQYCQILTVINSWRRQRFFKKFVSGLKWRLMEGRGLVMFMDILVSPARVAEWIAMLAVIIKAHRHQEVLVVQRSVHSAVVAFA